LEKEVLKPNWFEGLAVTHLTRYLERQRAHNRAEKNCVHEGEYPIMCRCSPACYCHVEECKDRGDSNPLNLGSNLNLSSLVIMAFILVLEANPNASVAKILELVQRFGVTLSSATRHYYWMYNRNFIAITRTSDGPQISFNTEHDHISANSMFAGCPVCHFAKIRADSNDYVERTFKPLLQHAFGTKEETSDTKVLSRFDLIG